MLFVLYTLLLVIATVGSATVAFGIKGILVGAILLTAAEFVRCAQSPRQTLDRTVIAILGCLLLFGMLLVKSTNGWSPAT